MHMHDSTHHGWWQAGTTKDAVQPCRNPGATPHNLSDYSHQQPAKDWQMRVILSYVVES